MDASTSSFLMLAYFAGLMLIISMAVTSIRRLRYFALAAGLAALAYVVLAGSGVVAILLAAVFVGVNSLHLFGLWRLSRSGTMLEEERALFARLLGDADSAQGFRLNDLLRWRDVEPGEVLMRQGDREPPLVYVARGRIGVAVDGAELGTCGSGDFLGEMSLVSGHTASATATVVEASRIALFDRAALAQYARSVPEVGAAVNQALNKGLAVKVERMNQSVSRPDSETATEGQKDG